MAIGVGLREHKQNNNDWRKRRAQGQCEAWQGIGREFDGAMGRFVPFFYAQLNFIDVHAYRPPTVRQPAGPRRLLSLNYELFVGGAPTPVIKR